LVTALPLLGLGRNMIDKTKEYQAVLLCGGKGERLRPLTTDIPKPLIQIKGKPILGHILEHLDHSGVNEVVICTGYKSEKIQEYFEHHSENFNVKLVNSGDVDIIKRLQEAARFIKTDFLVLYGDTLSNIDLQLMIDFHKKRPEKATISVWPLRSQFGLMEVNNADRVISYKEKPLLDKWINIGYFYFDYSLIPLMSDFSRFEDFLQALVTRGELNAYKHLGVHITVNTLKELEEAEENIDNIHVRGAR